MLTNLGSYRSDILFNHSCEIKHILFLDHYDCLVAADSIGNIMFFAVGFTKLKNKLLCQKQYMTLSATNSLENFPIQCMSFHSKRGLLLFGDDFGNVTVWDISAFLIKLNEFHVEDKKSVNYIHYEMSRGEEGLVVQEQKCGSGKDRKKEKEDSSVFLTMEAKDSSVFVPNLSDESIREIFLTSDIEYKHQIKSSHLDGITSLEVTEHLDIFATSSFDCCAYVWSFLDFEKVGSLILGHDRNWKLNIDESKKFKDEQEECT